MSEHTDAARLEAARDAMRTAPTPERRVGEGLPPTCRGCGDEFDDEALCWACARDVELDRDELTEKVTRLTAEVERLRGIAQQAIWMLNEWDESMSSYQQGTSDGATAKELAARLVAALSLPTPAPLEGTNDD